MNFESPEAAAKVALLTHLRGTGQLRSRAIISELTVARWARRADLVAVGSEMICFEVKSRADRLSRLEDQLQAYSAVFDRVYAAVATKHINAVMSRVPSFIGLKEIVQIGGVPEARPVRDSLPSPAITTPATLNLLPVAELARLIRTSGGGPCGGKNRDALLEMANEIPQPIVRAHLREYLRTKHAASSAAFWRAIAGRRIRTSDLMHLSVWQSHEIAMADTSDAVADWLSRLAKERAFGTVPDDIQDLLRKDQSS